MKSARAAALTLLAVSTAVPAIAQTSPSAQAENSPTSRVVVFGDSLSDGGYYLTLVPALPRDGGRFTTNPDPVAPEIMASKLGITLLPVYGKNGTNYAVGGARVSVAAPPAISITSQINNFLAAGGVFKPNDLVYIQGGGNDYFAYQALGGTNDAILTTAATQLAAQVQRVQAAGARHIVTLAIQTGGSTGLRRFNQTYAATLKAANVTALYFDTDRLFNEIVANAPSFGITNVTGAACTVPSSLNCSRATLAMPNANETYVQADAVHPSGITQRIEGQAIASLVQAPEQIAGLRYAAQSTFRAQRDLFEGPMQGGSMRPGSPVSLFGGAAHHYYDDASSMQRIGITERGFAGALGADLALGAASGVGIAGGYSDGTGDFGLGQGGYRVRAWSGSGYARVDAGPVRLLADGTYGEADYDRLRRTVQLGPAVRVNEGRTHGNYVAGRLTGAANVVRGGGVGLGPDAAVAYERVRIDGYADGTTLSTGAAFGRQRIESLTGRFGLAARSLPGGDVRFFARADYEREFKDDPRDMTITPTGAPISYTTGVERADRNYLSYAMSVDGRIAGALSVRGGIAGYALREDRNSVTAFAGMSLTM